MPIDPSTIRLWTLLIFWTDGRTTTSTHATRLKAETTANAVTRHGHHLIAGWSIKPAISEV